MKLLRGRFYYGWYVVTAAAGAEFANAASAISILTVFLGPMTQEFGWNRTEISGATSLGAVLGASLAPFTGRLVDRFGSRAVLTVGGLVVALASMYLSLTQTLLGFYLAFTFSRVADQGMIKIGAATTAGKWFQLYRGRAIALVFFAGSAGIIVLAPVVQGVTDAVGWRAAWMTLGITMLAVGVVPSALIVRRQPEDMGLLVDGGATNPATALSTPTAGPTPRALGDEEGWRLGQVVRTSTFWLVLASLFVVGSASAGVGLHLVPHLTQQGLSPAVAVGAVSIMAASGAVGSLALGVLSERLSPKVIMVFLYLLVAASLAVLITAESLPKAYLFAALMGISGAGVNTIAPILWANYYGRESLGVIYGLSRAAQVSGFAIGPLVSGVVYDASGSYERAFSLFLFLSLGSSLLVLASRRPRRNMPH